MNIEEGDVVLCTVDRIVGTAVFVRIEGNGEGSIIFSEIAPGRIRNIRDYVVPKKKIVCKVLRVSGDRIDLSLRRVTQKEQKEVIEASKQEQSYRSILKSVLGNEEKMVMEILKKESLYAFFEKAKENPKDLEKLVGKDNSKKIIEILNTQKKKKIEVKKEFMMNSSKPDGIDMIKEIIGNSENVDIKYISAGRYSIRAESGDIKKADNVIRENLEKFEKLAKKQGMNFSIKEK